MEFNNTTVDDPCLNGVNPEYYHVQYYFYLVQQFIHFIGFFGNLISILAFKKQAAGITGGFYQQLNIMLIDLASIIFYSVGELGYMFINVWENNKHLSAQKNLFLVFLFVHAYTFAFWATTAGVVVINGACIERLYGLYKPIKYTDTNKKRLALCMFCFALFVGFITNVQTFYVHQITWSSSQQIYLVTVSIQAIENPMVKLMTHLQTFVHLFGLCTLAIFAFLIIFKYKKVIKIHWQSNHNYNKPVAEKALTKLLFAQCCINFAGLGGLTVSNILIKMFLIPWCSRAVVINDFVAYILLALQNSSNFLIYFGISKHFRQTVIALFMKKDLVGPRPRNQARNCALQQTRF